MGISTTHPGLLSDRFDLHSQAGTGGMGIVYRAVDRTTGEAVAVKVLHSKATTDIARFDQEAALLAELKHPGIVRYVAHGITGRGEPYIAMEWLEGETLEERLIRGALTPGGTCQLAVRTLDALAAAHSRGIIHRDIKPNNIFLRDWHIADPRILDFGVARRMMDSRRFTQKGTAVGTPMYFAPEQARGARDVDMRADLFSLGCVLYECLAGQPAFTGETPTAVMTKICLGQPPKIALACPGLPVELTRLIDGMLTRDRNKRMGDAAALLPGFVALARTMAPEEGEGGGAKAGRGKPPVRETVSDVELRAMCALVIAVESPGEVEAQRIRNVAAPFGGEVDGLGDGFFLVTPAARGVMRDQAFVLARAALAVRKLLPQVKMALGMGRAALLAKLPVGPLVDDLAALVTDAAPGAILVDETTFRLLRTCFTVADRGLEWQLEGEREDEAPTASPCVGRDRELAALGAMLDECASESVARVALLLGPAGAGKTRLKQELGARRGEGATDPLVLAAPGGLMRAQSPEPVLGPVLAAAGIDPRSKPKALQEALVAWLLARSAERAVLLVLEDLHATDLGTIALLDALLLALRDRPFMVLALGRPEVDDKFPTLWSERAVERFRLPPLGRRAGQKLVRHFMPHCGPSIETFALDLWDGNPFFLEELLAMAATGVPAAPLSVLGTFEATQFEPLPPVARRILRAASIFLDKVFTIRMLVELLGEKIARELDGCLGLLVERNLLSRVSNADGAFVFASKLVQEAAYQMTSAADRALARRLACAFLEDIGRTTPDILALTGPRS